MFRFTKDLFASREQLQPLAALWLRKIFLEDWSTKLIALAISLGLWFVISGQQTPDTRPFSEVRLSFRVAGDLEISNDPARQVELTLTGDKGKLDRLDRRDLAISVDLSSYNQGERLVQLRPDSVSLELSSGNDLPAGLKVVDIQPNLVLLKLEPREEREVEVRAEFEGQLPDGMEIYTDETSVIPAKVRVRGPSSFVNSIDTVSTEKIDLGTRKSSFTARQVAVNLLNPKITVLDSVVDVNVAVGPKRSEKTFLVKAVNPAWATENYSVTVIGATTDLEKLKASDITIEFDRIDERSARPRAVIPAEFGRLMVKKSLKPDIVTMK